MQRLGLFGGTFDPVHNAHLRLALELKQHCQLEQMHLLPAHIPPHKQTPSATPEQRLQMLQLALADCTELGIDSRELRRHQPSYTVDTLAEIRAEVGDDVCLCWAVGGDSLAGLHRWHRWRELFDCANLIVAVRPGYQQPSAGPVAEFLQTAQITEPEQLAKHACGKVLIAELSQLSISATQIREQIRAGGSAQFLMPDAVWRFIQTQQLYRDV